MLVVDREDVRLDEAAHRCHEIRIIADMLSSDVDAGAGSASPEVSTVLLSEDSVRMALRDIRRSGMLANQYVAQVTANGLREDPLRRPGEGQR